MTGRRVPPIMMQYIAKPLVQSYPRNQPQNSYNSIKPGHIVCNCKELLILGLQQPQFAIVAYKYDPTSWLEVGYYGPLYNDIKASRHVIRDQSKIDQFYTSSSSQ